MFTLLCCMFEFYRTAHFAHQQVHNMNKFLVGTEFYSELATGVSVKGSKFLGSLS